MSFLATANLWMLVGTVFLFSGCAGDSAPEYEVPLDIFERDSAEPDPWTQEDLMDPAELAGILEDPARENPLILDIGGVGPIMGGRIQDSEVIGPTGETEYLSKLTDVVAEYPKDVDLVIYCGCCPFADCPNIRPAFRALKEMGLTNMKLLDIEENLRVDWVNLGYPTAEE